jgi:hypothetical protein
LNNENRTVLTVYNNKGIKGIMHKVIFCIGFFILTNFLPATASRIEKETDIHKVKVKSIEECRDCENKNKIILEAFNKKLNSKKEIAFSTRTVKVNELHILKNDRILVCGELGSGGDILSIVDNKTGRSTDTIWGWRASFSISKSMVAYTFRYPPSGLPLFYSDVLLVYDFSKSPLENAMDKSSTDDPAKRGFVLYPEENRKNKAYYTIAKDENEQHNITSPLVWNKSKLFFLDSLGGKTYLVTIDISKGLNDSEIKKRELDRKLFYEKQYLKHIDKEFEKDYEKAAPVAEDFRLTDGGQFIEIKPYAVGPFAGEKIKIKINE